MKPNTWKRREAPLPCIWWRAKRATIYMLSLLILFFIVCSFSFFVFSLKGLTFLEGSFATMGVLEAPQGMLNITSYGLTRFALCGLGVALE